jgi:hypothetical protein
MPRPNYFDPGNGALYETIKIQTCSGQPLEVTSAANASPVVVTTAGTPGSDAFGRARISQPLTLFDSSHRYSDNGLWATATGVGSDATFNANAGLVELNVPTTSGGYVKRETKKVFSYQPGKSLLVLSTFVMAPAKTNLRQRIGYFGVNNGLYLQLQNSTLSFVERRSITGTVAETTVDQADWNVDKLDGTGPSGLTLDITKAQIFWMDVEWLGLGTVRLGFVINGLFIHCHSFHHANLIESTYITTASLPLRYEIENLGTTASSSTLKQVCSTVISEGGYELRGRQGAVGTPLAAMRDLTATGVLYPIVSLRLKASPDRLDAIVIPTAVSILGDGNNAFFEWRLQSNPTTSGGTWTSASNDSSVEYNLSGVSSSGGRTLAKGYISSTTQSNNAIDILKEALFQFQLQRNGFTSTPEEFSLLVQTKVAGDDVYASIDWEEISL